MGGNGSSSRSSGGGGGGITQEQAQQAVMQVAAGNAALSAFAQGNMALLANPAAARAVFDGYIASDSNSMQNSLSNMQKYYDLMMDQSMSMSTREAAQAHLRDEAHTLRDKARFAYIAKNAYDYSIDTATKSENWTIADAAVSHSSWLPITLAPGTMLDAWQYARNMNWL